MRRSRLMLLGLLSLLMACSSGGPESAGARPAVPVSVATAVQKDVPVEIRAIGNVEPYSTVAVKSQIEGQVAEVRFQEGQRVARGDRLFVIDPRPFEAALKQAEANLARDRAAAENADIDFKRRATLVERGYTSKEDYDQARTAAATSRAVVKADEAAVENAKLQLQYCYIHSPIDGRIGQILVHAGNVVKSNDTTMAVVNQLRPVFVSFAVPEQHLPAIREHAAAQTLHVRAFLRSEPADPIEGTLSFINNAVDTTTGTVLLKGVFPNKDERLWPGQFVDAALTLAIHPNAILVPAEAVQTGQQGQYVFVVKSDLTAEVRPVTTGDAVGADIVITKGITAGERVVTEGQIRLAPGLKVEIKAGAEAAATPGSGA